MKEVTVLFVVILCTAACAIPPLSPGGVVGKLFDALTDSDCKAFASLFSENGVIVPLFGGPSISGRSNIQDDCLEGNKGIIVATANYSYPVVSGLTATVSWEGSVFTADNQFLVSGGIEYFTLNPHTGLLDLVVNFEEQHQTNASITREYMRKTWSILASKDCQAFAELFASQGNWTDGGNSSNSVTGRTAIRAACENSFKYLSSVWFIPFGDIIVTANAGISFVNAAVTFDDASTTKAILIWGYHLFVYDDSWKLLAFTSYDALRQ